MQKPFNLSEAEKRMKNEENVIDVEVQVLDTPPVSREEIERKVQKIQEGITFQEYYYKHIVHDVMHAAYQYDDVRLARICYACEPKSLHFTYTKNGKEQSILFAALEGKKEKLYNYILSRTDWTVASYRAEFIKNIYPNKKMGTPAMQAKTKSVQSEIFRLERMARQTERLLNARERNKQAVELKQLRAEFATQQAKTVCPDVKKRLSWRKAILEHFKRQR